MRLLSRFCLALCLIGVSALSASAQDAPGVIAQPHTFPFTSDSLHGADTLQRPSSLQFGADGRLYVTQTDGVIRIYTIERQAKGVYRVTDAQTIDLIQQIPNHDDDGQPQPYVQRQVTGILLTGSADQPVIYVTSSDYRQSLHVDNGLDIDSGVDTNSGILSRLTWDGAAWHKLDLVRGLPRSPLDHATNGMALDPATDTLYVAQGGNSNMGASLADNDVTPEYAYSAAILTVDLDAIGDTTYDLPTLDDPNRPGNPDANDPFGGDGGLNQAVITPESPVQVYATGFRNPYDLVLTDSGRLYTITNGANSGWGGPPTDCTNATVATVLPSDPSSLHLVTPGYYAGHPNPTRANAANLFAGQSPILQPDPQECDYIPPAQTGALALWDGSVNGLTEYTASNFGGALKGSLLAADYYGPLRRIQLNATGDAVVQDDVLFENFGAYPLDVTAQGDADPFPGTIWVAVLGDSKIQVFEPFDYQGAEINSAAVADYSTALDSDGDGYSNADEYDNGTDPLNPASRPPDFDGDGISNRNDPDDDNDGIDDRNDPFALDPANGAATVLPLDFTWDGGNPGTGLLGTGFTGLMINHSADYAALFDPEQIIAGGANGWLTLENVPPGDPIQDRNDQRDALQVGVPNGTFTVKTRLLPPFFNDQTPQLYQSEGVYVGTGDQDNYAKIILTSYGFQVVYEESGVSTEQNYPVDDPARLFKSQWIDLTLSLDGQGAVHPYYRTSDGTQMALPPVSPAWLPDAPTLAVGILATSKEAPPFTAIWDYLMVEPGMDAALTAIPSATPAPTAETPALPVCDFRTGTPVPVAHYMGQVVVYDGRAYLLGGFTEGLVALNRLDVYDPASDQWSQGADLPHAVTHQAALLDDATGTIWMAGGFIGDEPGVATDEVWKYDPAADQWRAAPSLPMPVGGGQLALLGRTLHYVGGVGSDRDTGLADHWTLDLTDPNAVWKSGLAGLIQPRIHFGIAVLNGAIYVVGGEIHHDTNPVEIASVERYDPAADSWARVADLPYTRSHIVPSTFADDGKLYVVGGQSVQINAPALNDVLVYDPAADQWQEGGYFPEGRFSPSARIIDGEYVIISGGPDWTTTTPGVLVGHIGQDCAATTEPPAANQQVAPDALPVCAFRSGTSVPLPRFESQSILIDQRVYILGGFTTGLVGLNRLDIYDVAADQWSRGADLPHAVTHQATAYDPATHQIWMAGGFLDNDPGPATGEVWRYDVAANRWNAEPSLPLPVGSGELVLLGRTLHFLGGFASDRETNLTAHFTLNLDAPNATWQEGLAPMIQARAHFAAKVLDGAIYAIGGQIRHEINEQEFASVERYDPETDTWTPVAALPFAISHIEAATFVRDGKLYVVGGRSLPTHREGIPDVLVYDPAADTWTTVGYLPAPRTGLFAGVVNGEYVVIGGGRSWINPATEVWLGQIGKVCASLNDHVALPTVETQTAHAPDALIQIEPPPSDHPSTNDAGSFRLANLSTGGQQIVSAQFDLSASLLPNTIFDPDGSKGDSTGKPFTVDQADGFQVTDSQLSDTTLTLHFADFDPGETLTFSLDVDPAELRGQPAPGPDSASSVDGIELIGTQVTLEFSDGAQRTTWLYHRLDSQVGSINVADIPTDSPALQIVGTASPGDQQVVRFPDLPALHVTGQPGDHVLVLTAYGTYHTDASLGAPPDVFAFNAIDHFDEQPVTIPESGSLELPITFTDAGVYTVIAVTQDANGAFSRPSNRVTLAYGS